MELRTMTTNNNLKRQSRERAAATGVSYAQARRETIEGNAAQDPAGTVAMFAIQQEQRADGVLPYPFFVSETGFVDRQDFWRGDPFLLVGFVSDPEKHTVDLHVQDWVKNPQAAHGMTPVLSDRKGRFSTYTGPVESITDYTVTRSAPGVATARYTNMVTNERLSVGVGHLMWLLNDRDFDGSPREGVVRESALRDMLSWLVRDPGGQDLDAVEGFLERLGDTTPDNTEIDDWLTCAVDVSETKAALG